MSRGFTLLEVLVGVAILGLGLTTILSAQVGLFASSIHASELTIATGLVRCKMSEVELDLLRDGYSLIDESDEGDCCEDESPAGFTCSWRVERIELPLPPEADLFPESGDESDFASMAGPLGALASIETSQGAVLGGQADLGSVSELMGGAAMGGVTGMAPLVMGIVYPELKAMLEASIRKITVKVLWKEGKQDRDLEVVQFVSNPTQGGFDPLAAEGLTQAIDGLTGAAGAGSTTVTGPGSTTVTVPGSKP